MRALSLHSAVDVAPFAACQARTTPCDYEVWWEDPRDLYQVTVQFAPGAARMALPPDHSPAASLEYWQHSWPGARVPKGAQIGSGRIGWLPIDDWTNGRWQAADCKVKQEGDTWSYTFRPLNLYNADIGQEEPTNEHRSSYLNTQSRPIGD